MSTAILIPVERAQHIAGLRENITAATPSAHVVYWACEAEGECRLALRFYEDLYLLDGGGTWGHRLNELYSLSSEPYFFTGADDVKFHDGWLEAALAVMANVEGVVAVNDLFNPHGTLALVSRQYIEENDGTMDRTGPVIHQGYVHCFSETELFETAKARGRFAYCEQAVVEHMHPYAGKGQHDEVYRKGEQAAKQDGELYLSRTHLWGS